MVPANHNRLSGFCFLRRFGLTRQFRVAPTLLFRHPVAGEVVMLPDLKRGMKSLLPARRAIYVRCAVDRCG